MSYHPAGKRDAESHRPDRAATVKADRLQLRDMAFNSPNSEWN